MLTRSELQDWGLDHGYLTYRCPRCHTRFATDSAVECPQCGESEEEEAEDATELDD